MTKTHSPTNFIFYVFMFYVVLIYSGLPDYVTVITKVKPGLLCVILFFFSWLRTKAYKKDLSELEVVLLLLIVSQSMASLFYANNTGSVKKLLQSEILNIIAFVFGGMLAISSIERLKKYLKLWVVLGALICIQVIFKGGTGPGRLGDENDVALTVVIMMPFFYYGFSYFSGILKYICLIGIFLAIVAVVVTASRGGFLALAATSVMIFLYSEHKVKLAGVFLIGMMLSISIFLSQGYIDDLRSISDTEESTADERLYSWGLGVDMYLDNPIFGLGTGQFGWNVMNYQEARGDFALDDEGLNLRRNLAGRTSHSTYVDYFSERGIVGVFLLFLLIRALYRRLKNIGDRAQDLTQNPQRYFYLASACGLVGNAVGSLFVTSFYFPNFWLFIGLIVAVSRLPERETIHPN